MIAYLYLSIAIVAEVIATTALRAAAGFTVLWPSALSVADMREYFTSQLTANG